MSNASVKYALWSPPEPEYQVLNVSSEPSMKDVLLILYSVMENGTSPALAQMKFPVLKPRHTLSRFPVAEEERFPCPEYNDPLP